MPDNAMQPQERALYEALKARRGELRTIDELMEVIYPDPDLEPIASLTVLRARIHTLRHIHGVTIETVRGYRLPK